MRRYGLGFIAFLLAGLLVLGSLSAVANRGGPFQGGGQGPTSALQAEDDEEDEDDEDEADDVDDEDEADDEDGDFAADAYDGDDDVDNVDAQYEGDAGQGAEQVAQAIADAFDVELEDVLELHAEEIGFGALFKLYALAQAQGITIDELLDEIGFMSDDEHDFAFGQLKKELDETELEALGSGPKNLGQLVSASHKSDDGTEATSSSHGHGHGNGRGHDRHHDDGDGEGEGED